jgi:Protein of unknown function (DUF1194)
MMWGRALFLSATILCGGAWADCPDLQLVLAIDASGSIDAAEFALQQAGYSAAFQSAEVQRALGQTGVVDVAAVFWADSEMAPQITPWFRVAGLADTLPLSAALLNEQRRVMGSTGMGNGVWAALDLLAEAASGARQVINLSGDGAESYVRGARAFLPIAVARARAQDMGVTINALAIERADDQLDAIYRRTVITGPDAFVVQVAGFSDITDALARKLAREIGPALVAAGPAEGRAPGI